MRILVLLFVILISYGCSQPKNNSKNAKEEHEKENVVSNVTSNDSYTYKIFSVNNSWGYDIYRNNELYVHQPNIPAVPGNRGFRAEEQAASVAKLAIEKLKHNISPPTISKEELDSLKAL